VNWPRPYLPDFKPHTSQHASGQYHHKSFGHFQSKVHRQRPDINFVGVENLVTFGIDPREPSAVGEICDPLKFTSVFEIAAPLLGEQRYVAIDLAAPGGAPIVTTGAHILQRAEYQHAVPWILVTFFQAVGFT
jgi:hypothetical protein